MKAENNYLLIKDTFITFPEMEIGGASINLTSKEYLYKSMRKGETESILVATPMIPNYNGFKIRLSAYTLTRQKKRRFLSYFVSGGIFDIKYDCSIGIYEITIEKLGDALLDPVSPQD